MAKRRHVSAPSAPSGGGKQGSKVVPWRGDEHQLQVAAAAEAGLEKSRTEVDLYTRGFTAGMTVEDPYDGSIVARGRTVLADKELLQTLRPTLHYLGVGRDAVKVRVHDGEFELRVDRRAADASSPALDSAKLALQLWIGFGLLGLAGYWFIGSSVAAVLWGVGLLLGGWQVRRGLASGRAMLSARLALALGMLAKEQQLILPPARGEDDAA